jgi:hypothetical protein
MLAGVNLWRRMGARAASNYRKAGAMLPVGAFGCVKLKNRNADEE